MKFTITEKELLLSKASQLLEKCQESEKDKLVLAYKMIEEDKMIFGNYLHALFLALKKGNNQLGLSDDFLMLEKKILRRINANK